jgi:hypothetical protein
MTARRRWERSYFHSGKSRVKVALQGVGFNFFLLCVDCSNHVLAPPMPGLYEIGVGGLRVTWPRWLPRNFLGIRRLGTTNGLFLSCVQIRNSFFGQGDRGPGRFLVMCGGVERGMRFGGSRPVTRHFSLLICLLLLRSTWDWVLDSGASYLQGLFLLPLNPKSCPYLQAICKRGHGLGLRK